jgi:transcriptional regulator with XRE-family HTH domain
MTRLAEWLRGELEARNLSQNLLAARSGVGLATINDVLNKEHIPRAETLFRLAESLDTSRVDILYISGHLTTADRLPRPDYGDEENLTWQLVEEFRRVPDPWKRDAIDQIRWIARLAKRPAFRVVGEE